jgi:hypothetical protein
MSGEHLEILHEIGTLKGYRNVQKNTYQTSLTVPTKLLRTPPRFAYILLVLRVSLQLA